VSNYLGEELAVVGRISPVSQGAGTVDSNAIDCMNFRQLMAVIKSGVLGAAATLDAKFQSCATSGGAYTDIPSASGIPQLVKATDDNKEAVLCLNTDRLPDGHRFVKLRLTVGAAASLVDATILGGRCRYEPVADYDATTVASITFSEP